MIKKKGKIPLGLIKNFMPRPAKDMFDISYIDKLSPEDKKFLGQFIEEYYLNVFKRKKGLHDKAGISRTELYNATNARNRDIWNKAKRSHYDTEGALDYAVNKNKQDSMNANENAVIKFIDKKHGLPKGKRKGKKKDGH